MLRTLVVVVALIYGGSAALAAPYSYEASVSHSSLETDFTETDTTVVEGTYYFKPVVVGDAPLAEAAFVAMASSVSLSYTRRSFEAQLAFIAEPQLSINPNIDFNLLMQVDPVPSNAVIFVPSTTIPNFIPSPALSPFSDENTWGAAGRYVSANGWIGDVAYSRFSDDSSSSSLNFMFSSDFEVTRFSLGAGKYLGKATTLTVRFDDQSSESGRSTLFTGMTQSPPLTSPLIAPPSSSQSEATVRGFTLTAKTLIDRGDYTHSLGANAGYDVLENDFSFTFQGASNPFQSFSDKSYALRTGLGYTFYPRQNLGFGLGYEVNDAEFGTDKVLDLSVEWFVTPDISLKASYLRTDTDSSFLDSDGFGVGITGRL